ncbi:hypothetical protein F5890DRAFT_1542768 [Lentinula detonsa]|uniref:Secreted protein n=1 Tax=Lentinula detonsa TaxID=2804962 RepID=A0AA38UQF6_9AGAR|nr:hypothetical protein F5890DRAFT_1542768 [Lentinula detonsa]
MWALVLYFLSLSGLGIQVCAIYPPCCHIYILFKQWPVHNALKGVVLGHGHSRTCLRFDCFFFALMVLFVMWELSIYTRTRFATKQKRYCVWKPFASKKSNPTQISNNSCTQKNR